MVLINPVPTSGEIRALRRRLRLLAPALADAADRHAAAPADGHDQHDPGPPASVTDRVQVLVAPALMRVLTLAAAAGRSGLDALERASDDTHDAVEEQLARLASWSR